MKNKIWGVAALLLGSGSVLWAGQFYSQAPIQAGHTYVVIAASGGQSVKCGVTTYAAQVRDVKASVKTAVLDVASPVFLSTGTSFTVVSSSVPCGADTSWIY